MPQPALFVFAKQPVPGLVKTRLQPEHSPERAAEIATLLIRETVGLAVSTWPGQVYLCGAPTANHPLFEDLARTYDIEMVDQGEGDLGQRMHRALAFGIEEHGAAAVLGCDVPHCPWEELDEASEVLGQGRSVLGPTDDGGYYLIGLTTPYIELFEEMAWGKPTVLLETLRRAEERAIEFTLLTSLRDIDTAVDLWLAAQRYEPLRRFL